MLTLRHLEHLGEALKRLRGASGCTQAEICARTGLKRPQLSRWENGRDVPTLESLVRYLGAVGAGLADLERELLGDEEQERRKELTQALREIHAGHRRYLRSTFHVRLAFTRLARPNPDGLERRWLHLLDEDALPPAGRRPPAPSTPADAAPEGAIPEGDAPKSGAPVGAAPDAELEQLIAGLPETLDELLGEPTRRRPAVVEGMIGRGWQLLDRYDDRAVHVADAARLAAGELPVDFGRDRCFTLRARGLELWGMALKAMAEPATAEAALLAAFELLAQTPGAEPPELAAILGRLALVAGDRGHPDDLERYAGEAVRVVLASDREQPMPAFLHLWRTVSSDYRAPESIDRVARAVFNAMWKTFEGFQDHMWELTVGMFDGAGAGPEIQFGDKRRLPDLVNWVRDLGEDAGPGDDEE